MRLLKIIGAALLALHATAYAQEAKPAPVEQKDAAKKITPAVSTIAEDEIAGFTDYAPALQKTIRKAIELTKLNLGYQFGSSDPTSGGMDCSGTIYHLLQCQALKETPRQSDEMCRWVMLHSVLYRTENITALKDAAFSALKPGDLLFWTGTYDTASPRSPPITHVMIYLGKRVKDGKPVTFGASDGRSYDGQRRSGVSVFDFPLPPRGDKSAFYGYGPVPGLSLATQKP